MLQQWTITRSQKPLRWRWTTTVSRTRLLSDDAISDDTEYVDDPQIDLLSA